MSFVSNNILESLPNISRAEADAAPIGIVQVDDHGAIKLYNKWESEMADVPAPSAEGRNFFTQVAPCTNNRLFFGKFKDGVAQGTLDTEFNYTFSYKMKPTNVQIRLYRHPASRTNWVFVAPRAA